MYSSPAEILAAVNEYRSYIAAQNRRALEIFIPFITNAKEPEEGDFDNDFDVDKQRMEVLRQLVGDGYNVLDKEGITAPAELLDRYDDLVPRLGLDGTIGISIDSDDRPRKQDEYLSAIEEALKKKCIEEVRGIISIPEEFRTLAEYVDGLYGPGLEYWRGKFQYAAWWGLIEDYEVYSARVQTPDELTWLAMPDRGYTVGGGWVLGMGPDAELFAVYCRRIEDYGWDWRYVMTWEGGEEVFETIPGFLAWYVHFREQDLSGIPEFDEEDMWVLMF